MELKAPEIPQLLLLNSSSMVSSLGQDGASSHGTVLNNCQIIPISLSNMRLSGWGCTPDQQFSPLLWLHGSTAFVPQVSAPPHPYPWLHRMLIINLKPDSQDLCRVMLYTEAENSLFAIPTCSLDAPKTRWESMMGESPEAEGLDSLLYTHTHPHTYTPHTHTHT